MCELDFKKTKENILDILNNYNHYVLSVAETNQIYVDKNYTFEDISNNCLKKYNDSKTKNLMQYKYQFVNFVRKAFNKISILDRKIIYLSFLEKEHEYDDRFIANTLGFSLGYFYVKKKKAMINFAY